MSSPSLFVTPYKSKTDKQTKTCKKFGFPPGFDWTKPRPTPLSFKTLPASPWHPPRSRTPPSLPPSRHFPPQHLLSRFGTSAGRRRLAAWAGSIVCPFVQAPASSVHEEVADGGEFKAQLLRDGELHLFGRPLVLLEDGQQGAPLQVCEDQPRLLWCVVALLRRVLFLPFTCFEEGGTGRDSRGGERK